MPESPTVFAANIPKITSLRKDLDYDDARLPRCAAFNDDTRAFRRKFKTSRGTNGVDLHDWRSEATQAGLDEMTTAYLDKQGNGQLFWPDDRSSQNYNKYQYSRHRDHIRRLVKQLFFRLNQQQFRNQKYKHKQSSDAPEEDGTGYSRDAPIDLDTITITTSQDTIAVSQDGLTIPAEQRISERPDLGETSDLLPAMNRRDIDEDWYEVPESRPASPLSPSPQLRQFEPINQSSRTKRAYITLTNWKTQAQQAKRQKKTAATNTPNQKRESPRVNKAQGVPREGYVTGTDAIKSMSKAVSPERGNDSSQQSDTVRGVTDDWGARLDSSTHHSPTRRLRRSPTPEASASASRGRGERLEDFATLDPELSRSILPSRTRAEQEPNSPSARRRPPSPDLSTREQFEKHSTVSLPTATSRTRAVLPEPALRSPLNIREDRKQPTSSHQQSNLSPSITSLAGGQNSRPSTSAGAKPSINFLYRVVLSRTPRTITERWNPEGRFQEKTLAELLKELPFQERDARGLVFTIDSDCMKTVERIMNDDEDSFASMKRNINREIKEWLRRQKRLGDGTPPKLAVDIVIEQMGEESRQGVDMLEDSDLELEW
ncbi:hypothetical protein B0T14DRAFT_209706 [Immersiella caudata]|uniref:Uncharacterized protein n=1 Tax=Immersiella caudata TaxID=314043 RepID=A0AA39WQ43_9PEZI|nr:hypothetical protein B0T14DRAFT_209706 [Immersiella caudata]